MPLLASTAQLLSLQQMERGVIETIIDRDDTLQMLPFTHVSGKSYVYDRENTLSGADWLSPNDTVNESAVDVTQVTALLKILAGDTDVDKFLSTTMNNINDQVAIQVQAKVKAVGRAFHQAFATGDATANPKTFDGIAKLVDPSQVIPAAVNGAAVTLSLLDQLKDQVIMGPDALVMRRGTWRSIKQLMRAAGGTRPEMLQLPNLGYPVPAFDGVPVLMNDFLSTTETQGTNTTTCSIYAVRFNEADGLHGLAGGDAAGMVVEDIGTVQNKDARRIRVKWYCGLALKSTRSLARLSGITSF